MTHRTAALLTLAGGVMVAIGSFLPWISAVTAFGSADVAGTSGDGIFTLAAGGLIALLAVTTLDKPVSSNALGLLFLAGTAAAVFGVWEISNVSGRLDTGSELVRASVGVGLYVVVAGGIAAVVGAMRMDRAAPPADPPPPDPYDRAPR